MSEALIFFLDDTKSERFGITKDGCHIIGYRSLWIGHLNVFTYIRDWSKGDMGMKH